MAERRVPGRLDRGCGGVTGLFRYVAEGLRRRARRDAVRVGDRRGGARPSHSSGTCRRRGRRCCRRRRRREAGAREPSRMPPGRDAMPGDDGHCCEERLRPVGDRDANEVPALLQAVHLGGPDLKTIEPRTDAARERSRGEAARARPDQRDVETVTSRDAKEEVHRTRSSVTRGAARDPE